MGGEKSTRDNHLARGTQCSARNQKENGLMVQVILSTVWGWREGAGVFPVGVGDLGVAVREDRDGFLGEKALEIGRAAQGASQRWEEAGRRKLGPGDHRAATWPGSGRGGNLGSHPTAES